MNRFVVGPDVKFDSPLPANALEGNLISVVSLEEIRSLNRGDEGIGQVAMAHWRTAAFHDREIVSPTMQAEQAVLHERERAKQLGALGIIEAVKLAA